MSKRVVVTDHAFGDVVDEHRTATAHGARFDVFACQTEADTAEAVIGADVALVNFAPITAAVMRGMRPGAVVIRYGVGYDNVDVDAAARLGIRVANVPDYGVQTVADHSAAALLSLARRLHEYDHRIRSDGWVTPGQLGTVRGFRSMVVGLVGMGRIAREVHRRLAPFGFSFVGHDPYAAPEVFRSAEVEPVNLCELAARAHAVSLHAPGTQETHHLLDETFFTHARPGMIVVNTARGSLIDERALLAAIAAGTVQAAALDVHEEEPLPSESPLRAEPRIRLTPHAAFYDEDSIQALQRLASDEMARALRGEPLRCQVRDLDGISPVGATKEDMND